MKAELQKDHLFAGPFHKWQQKPRLGQAKARILELHPRLPNGWLGYKYLKPSSAAFPDTGIESWTSSGTDGNQAIIWHHGIIGTSLTN